MLEPEPGRVLGRMREIDRRKHAAAKPAQDAKIARQREMWRENKKRNRKRIQGVQTGTAISSQCESKNAEKDERFQELFGTENPLPQAKSNPIRSDLVKLSRDRKAPASARVTALRTLAEMDGLVGKLQTQANETADQPLGTMSRSQLEAELARLRAIVAGRGT